MNDHEVAMILDAMEREAQDLRVTGVAVFMRTALTDGNTLHPHVRVVERLERPAQPEERGEEDTGTNYFGVVMGKVGEMLSTTVDSGCVNRPPRTGENGWPGGRIFTQGHDSMLFAFSGGTGEQDVLIAEAGAREVGLL